MSSRLGWVAAVIAIVSPSHPRPAVIQRMSISEIDCRACELPCRIVVVSVTRSTHEGRFNCVFYTHFCRRSTPIGNKMTVLEVRALEKSGTNRQVFGRDISRHKNAIAPTTAAGAPLGPGRLHPADLEVAP